MDNLEKYRLIKKEAEQFINDRHMYVASIIKKLFDPTEHRNLCEIGSGKLELAKILAQSYETIDAYDSQSRNDLNTDIKNLKVYSNFNRFVNISNYHLILSVCPYYYTDDTYDESDFDKETQDLITDILNLSIENKTNLFLVLSNTHKLNDFVEEIKNKEKYKNLIYDDIMLKYKIDGKKKTSNNKVLIYKK